METITCRNNFDELVDVPKSKFAFRPSAYGIIVHDGRVLLMRNKGNGKLWLPGGGVEVGEKIEAGLVREIKEETGLDVTIEKYLFMRENFFYYQPLDEAYHAFLFFYHCKSKSTDVLSDGEVDDLESEKPRWHSIKDIKAEEIADFSEDILAVIKEVLNSTRTKSAR